MLGPSSLLRSMLVLAVLLSGTGCNEGEYEGAVLTQRRGLRAGGMLEGGRQCVGIALGKSTGSGETYIELDWYALYTQTGGGELRQQLYIHPESAPPDTEVTRETGELAMEWTFASGELGEDEFLIDEIETHAGDLLWISHWGEDTSCSDEEPPAGFEQPGP